MKVKGYLVIIDIEKAFDSLKHTFLISALEKLGFGKTFIDWMKIYFEWPGIVSNKLGDYHKVL